MLVATTNFQQLPVLKVLRPVTWSKSDFVVHTQSGEVEILWDYYLYRQN